MKTIDKYKIYIAAISLFSLLTGNGYAQRSYNSITYNVAVPTGETADFIDQTSFRGIGIEIGRYIVRDKFSVGIGGNWNVFYKAIRGQSVQFADTVTLTGSQFRYINSIPIYITGKYYFGTASKLVPYAGLGVGTAYARNENNIGLARLFSNGWQFAMHPEVGFRFRASSKTELLLNSRYHVGFATQSVPPLSYVTLNIGLNFMY